MVDHSNNTQDSNESPSNAPRPQYNLTESFMDEAKPDDA